MVLEKSLHCYSGDGQKAMKVRQRIVYCRTQQVGYLWVRNCTHNLGFLAQLQHKYRYFLITLIFLISYTSVQMIHVHSLPIVYHHKLDITIFFFQPGRSVTLATTCRSSRRAACAQWWTPDTRRRLLLPGRGGRWRPIGWGPGSSRCWGCASCRLEGHGAASPPACCIGERHTHTHKHTNTHTNTQTHTHTHTHTHARVHKVHSVKIKSDSTNLL